MDGTDSAALRVHLGDEDRQWLARFARREGMSVAALIALAVWHFRTWQQRGKHVLREVLDLIDLVASERRAEQRCQRYLQRHYESQLRHERALRRAYQNQLRRERALRRAYEKQLRQQRCHDGRRVDAPPPSNPDPPYGPKVAKLLALAVCTDSDGEATAAFVRARALQHLPVFPHP